MAAAASFVTVNARDPFVVAGSGLSKGAARVLAWRRRPGYR